MTYVLGDPCKAGSYTIQAVSCQSTDTNRVGRFGVALYCSKTPVYVVVSDGQGRVVLDMNGRHVPLKTAQAICTAI